MIRPVQLLRFVALSLALLACRDATSPSTSTPAGVKPANTIVGATTAIQISMGNQHSCALKSDRTIVCWGLSAVGSANLTTVPAGLTSVAQVSAGQYHTCALKTDATVVCWGWDQYGETLVPADLPQIVEISAGNATTCGLKTDGTVVCWGRPGFATAPPGLTSVAHLSGGAGLTCALKTDGTVVCWPSGDPARAVPEGLGPVLQVNAGKTFSCVVKADGTVFCWGTNPNNGTPVPAGLNSVTQVTSRFSGSCVLKTNGNVVCWGFDGDDGEGMATVPAGLSSVIQVSAGGYHTCALKADGKIVCWGVNQDGQTDVPADLASISEQAIAYTSTPPTPALTGGTYTLSATGGGSGNAVTFSSLTTSTCTVSGTTVTLVAIGSCTIAADQAAAPGYNAAPQVTQTFTILSSAQSISFTSTPPIPALTGGVYNVTATGGASGNPVTFSSLTISVCTVSASTVSLVAIGSCTIAANQAAGNGYSAATQTTQTFSVTGSLTPTQQLQNAVALVDQMVANGTLSSGNGNSMKTKLNNASASITSGNYNAALAQLNSLLNQLAALANAGKLNGPEAVALRALINDVIATIS